MDIPNFHSVSTFPPSLQTSRQTQARIKIRIPKDLHEEPVISRLVSHYGITVNIAAAGLN